MRSPLEIDQSKIKIIKLSSGESLIAYLNRYDDTAAYLEHPHKVVTIMDPNEVGNFSHSWIPWIDLTEEKMFTLPLHEIVTIADASADGKEFFVSMIQSLMKQDLDYEELTPEQQSNVIYLDDYRTYH